MKNLIFLIAVLSYVSCKKEVKVKQVSQTKTQIVKLTLKEANRLSKLPLKCVDNQYPNKLGQVLASDKDIANPKTLHPAFYGCFDWHSSVHGHWSLVKLLKEFPKLQNAQSIKDKLLKNISKKNILGEVAYFKRKTSGNYERTYGWAWLLKLAEELHTWHTPFARKLENNLMPLTDVIVANFEKFLPKLHYPIRVGEHPNTAFGMSFAWDYATTLKDNKLKDVIAKRAKDFYLHDKNCPINWEPSGFDFLSPCLEEIDIMRKVLSKAEFNNWLAKFLPQITNKNFKLKVGIVSDRTDGKLVHLDGLNFSRAWCLYGLANQYPKYNFLKAIANKHILYSLPSIVDGNYDGGHWLGSFAIYALNEASK